MAPVGMHDAESFESWYETAHPRLVKALLVTCGGDPELAADAVDEAMVRALERWSRVGRMDNPEAWAYRVATNVVRRYFRRRGGEERALRKLPPVPEWVDPDQDGAVWAFVAQLAPRERRAIALRYILGYTEDEVAAALGVAPGTASALLSRTRRRMRDQLAAAGITQG